MVCATSAIGLGLRANRVKCLRLDRHSTYACEAARRASRGFNWLFGRALRPPAHENLIACIFYQSFPRWRGAMAARHLPSYSYAKRGLVLEPAKVL